MAQVPKVLRRKHKPGYLDFQEPLLIFSSFNQIERENEEVVKIDCTINKTNIAAVCECMRVYERCMKAGTGGSHEAVECRLM